MSVKWAKQPVILHAQTAQGNNVPLQVNEFGQLMVANPVVIVDVEFFLVEEGTVVEQA